MIAIGVDPGVNTGVAVWDSGEFKLKIVQSMNIIEAMDFVLTWSGACRFNKTPMIVIVEDARKRKGRFTIADANEEKYGGGVREGVGSVKRDSKIWEEFLTHHEIPFELRTPRVTKRSPEEFARMTAWTERTSKHGRDAAMIVFQLNNPMLSIKMQTYQQQRERGHEPRIPAGARLRTARRR